MSAQLLAQLRAQPASQPGSRRVAAQGALWPRAQGRQASARRTKLCPTRRSRRCQPAPSVLLLLLRPSPCLCCCSNPSTLRPSPVPLLPQQPRVSPAAGVDADAAGRRLRQPGDGRDDGGHGHVPREGARAFLSCYVFWFNSCGFLRLPLLPLLHPSAPGLASAPISVACLPLSPLPPWLPCQCVCACRRARPRPGRRSRRAMSRRDLPTCLPSRRLPLCPCRCRRSLMPWA